MRRPRKKALMKRIAALALPLGLAACVVGPKYAPRTAADLRIPAAWKAALPEGAATGDLSAWWNQLGDPLLTECVEEALTSSPTMDAARAKLRQARAQRRLTAAGLYPSVNASLGANASKSGGGDAATGYQAGFDAGWEPDIFGAQRLAVRAAEADLASAAESLHDTQVSLAAEVALEYVTVRSLQARLAIARDNLAFQKETREIAGWRYQAGLVSGLDYEQARTAEAQTRAQIPSLELSLAEARHRLAVLQGKAPGALDDRLAAETPLPAVPASVTVGIPADVLRQRPDVRSAERSFAAEKG
jgi:NodT family efflux transporter outer membrane factor (OMF) lipoprotein